MVMLTKEFGVFEFPRAFSLLLLPEKKCGKFKSFKSCSEFLKLFVL